MAFDFDPNQNQQQPTATQGPQTAPNPPAVGTPPVAPPAPKQENTLEYVTKLKTSKSGNAIVGGCNAKTLKSGETLPALFFCISKAKDGSGYHLSVKANTPQGGPF